jgi:Zn-dependent protease with chaperone function
MRLLALLLFLALPVQAQVTVLERRELAIEQGASVPTHSLNLTIALLRGSGWEADAIQAALRESARILGQCGITLGRTELVIIDAPPHFRDYYTPASRELARIVPLKRPAVYFVTGSRQRPAYEAVAIGLGNSMGRRELRDTVWVTHGARDLAIVLAHELAHILMNSGEHSEEPANLMRDETSPENSRLSAAQCARLRETGTANGLLAPL